MEEGPPGLAGRAGVNTAVLRDDAGGVGRAPPAVTTFCRQVSTGCYAVARTGPATCAGGLALRAFWKSASCCKAISIAWVMT